MNAIDVLLLSFYGLSLFLMKNVQENINLLVLCVDLPVGELIPGQIR